MLFQYSGIYILDGVFVGEEAIQMAGNKNIWLFNITADPTEHHDLSDSHPDIVKQLLDRLAFYNSTAVPCRYPAMDPDANPELHVGAWGPWVE